LLTIPTSWHFSSSSRRIQGPDHQFPPHLKPIQIYELRTTRKPKRQHCQPSHTPRPTHFLSHLIFLLLHSEQLCTTLLLVAIGFLSGVNSLSRVDAFHFPGEPPPPPPATVCNSESHSSGLAANDCNPIDMCGRSSVSIGMGICILDCCGGRAWE
jgi:hypothetical protein